MSHALPFSVMDPAELPLPGPVPYAAEASSGEVAALVADLRRGAENAVRLLHERYSARLTRYALVVCRGDDVAAAEAVQNTFLKAIRSLRPVADEGALWAWLARACRTSAMDRYRTARRYTAILAKFAEFLSPQEQSPPEDTEAIWQRALAVAMSTLSPEDRDLLDARYTRRLPLTAIAAHRDTTERAIEGRLARLREKLRQSILRQLATDDHES